MANNHAAYNPINYQMPAQGSPYLTAQNGTMCPQDTVTQQHPVFPPHQGFPPSAIMPPATVPMPEQMPQFPAMPETGNDMTPSAEQMPECLGSPVYTAGFMRQQTGRLMRVDFLLGSQIVSRAGRLIEVGASYIVLQSGQNGALIMCDLASVKFAVILPETGTGCEYAAAYGEPIM